MGDEDLAKEVLETFLEDVPRQIEALKGALKEGEAPLVRRQAHTLKGAAGNVGAVALQEVAFRMEKASAAEAMDKAASLMSQVAEQFRILQEAINHSGLVNAKVDAQIQ